MTASRELFPLAPRSRLVRQHALHLHLEELEAVDPTSGGGHLPGVHSGRGAPVRMGITEAGGWNTH